MVLRIARPTNQLKHLAKMYQDGLGFQELAKFEDPNGFDGVVLGHKRAPYHLEFTHHQAAVQERSQRSGQEYLQSTEFTYRPSKTFCKTTMA